MLITSAHAQAAGGGGGDMLTSMIPLVLIFGIFYFLLIRPQQKRAKEHRKMVDELRRGDKVVTQGGILGKVTKVKEDEDEVEVEIAKDVKVMIIRGSITTVLSKTEPVKE
ncbi:MAG: preprotein translocase subunit YajC [Pikeienuella sp.]